MKRTLVISFFVPALAGVLAVQATEGQQKISPRALSLHHEAIVIDTHIDTTSHVMKPGWKFDDRHTPPSPDRPGQGSSVDLPRMREGGVSGAFFAVYIPGTVTGLPAVKAALMQLDALNALVATHPADLALCRTAADVREAKQSGRVAVLIGIEGGHMINNDLAALGDFARRGARYLTLTHMVTTDWADSSGDKAVHDGLTPFGKDVVRELNRLGIMVDVSHVSDKTFWDVLEVSAAPPIASHSSCRALCEQGRNLTDEMIKALAAKGGIIQINFHAPFLDQTRYLKEKELEPELTRLRAGILQQYAGPEHDQQRASALQDLEFRLRPPGTTSWEMIIDHIDHAVRLVGADHVGLGSDFDGAEMPLGMEDCSMLPRITEALLGKGYSRKDIRNILGGNVLRVMEQVEKVAR